jgi:hypothetical protein
METSLLELLTHARTKESVDLFYINQYISEREYLAAMKFRWLYAQVNGNTQVKAYNPLKINGRDVRKNDAWLDQQASDFSLIKQDLTKENHYRVIFDICILNKPITNYQLKLYSKPLSNALLVLDRSFGKLQILKLRSS